jgi:NAD(P)-dependent dehydrogenase (short-subunit alcohol dehydrogenase family)
MSSGDGELIGGPTQRTLPRLRKVVVTGIAGRFGRIVARRLHHDLDYQIVGLDRRAMQGRPKDIEHHQVDLRSKKARDVFRGNAASVAKTSPFKVSSIRFGKLSFTRSSTSPSSVYRETKIFLKKGRFS